MQSFCYAFKTWPTVLCSNVVTWFNVLLCRLDSVHTHTHTYAHTHAHTYAHTHTHTLCTRTTASSYLSALGWRPAFRYYNRWVALVGALLSVAIMFVIRWYYAFITIIVVGALYMVVYFLKPGMMCNYSYYGTCVKLYNNACLLLITLYRVQRSTGAQAHRPSSTLIH